MTWASIMANKILLLSLEKKLIYLHSWCLVQHKLILIWKSIFFCHVTFAKKKQKHICWRPELSDVLQIRERICRVRIISHLDQDPKHLATLKPNLSNLPMPRIKVAHWTSSQPLDWAGREKNSCTGGLGAPRWGPYLALDSFGFRHTEKIRNPNRPLLRQCPKTHFGMVYSLLEMLWWDFIFFSQQTYKIKLWVQIL